MCNHVLSSKKKRSNWVLKFNCAKSKSSNKNTDIIPGQGNSNSDCICTGYRRTEEHPMGAGIVFNSRSAPQSPILGPLPPSPVIDLSRFNPEEFPMEVRSSSRKLPFFFGTANRRESPIRPFEKCIRLFYRIATNARECSALERWRRVSSHLPVIGLITLRQFKFIPTG